MNKLRFSKDEGTQFHKELREKVDKYFLQNGIPKTGNNKMIFKIVLYFVLIILFYALMITSTSLFFFATFYLSMGLVMLLGIFNISHDASHGIAVKSKFWNNLIYQVVFNLQGNNAYIWRQNHIGSHHIYTNVEGSDTEILYNPLIRVADGQQLKWYHRFQHIYAPFLYLFVTLHWLLFREVQMLAGHSDKTIKISIPRIEFFKLILYKLFYVCYMIVLPCYFLPFSWVTVLAVFILNHFVISLLFVAIFAVAHLSAHVSYPHAADSGKINMSWPKLQMCTAVDFDAESSFCNWLLGGNNTHTIHHLLPNICHVHYSHIIPIFKDICNKYGLTYLEMPYKNALASHFRFLKKWETKRLTYQYLLKLWLRIINESVQSRPQG